MAAPDFVQAAQQTSQLLRRLPRDLRRQFAARTRDEVAEPLAASLRGAGTSVYARRVAATVKARAGADPKIVAGGARRIVSGGARGRQIVFGNEFGGGNRVTAVPATGTRRGYRRHSTRQFRSRARAPFIFATVRRQIGPTFDRWVGIVDDLIGKEIPRG